MSTYVHMDSQDGLRIEPDDDFDFVWIRSPHASITLTLSRNHRDALRRALDAIEAAELEIEE